MVRGAGCDEMILLLFGEVVFLGFGWMFLILGGCARASHTPSPSEVHPKSWTGNTLSGNGKGSVLYRALSL